MRPILFGVLAVSLGCMGIDVPTDHTSTVTGTFGLVGVTGFTTAAPCYHSTRNDPTLVPPDLNTAYLSGGTLVFDAGGTGTFNAHYEVRHDSNPSVLVATEDSAYAFTYVRDGMDLRISWKGVPGNGQIFAGDATLWTRQPWCAGLSSPGTTQRFDFNLQGAG
jgi:hypothetical protein